MRFQGKIAIITGAGQGIGKATALCLSREGASVVLVDRAERECRAVAEEIIDASLDGVCSFIPEASEAIEDLRVEEASWQVLKESPRSPPISFDAVDSDPAMTLP